MVGRDAPGRAGPGIRVLLVERRRLFAAALAAALAADPALELVGCAGDLRDGDLGRLRPDVAVVGVALVRADGGALDALRAAAPGTKALVLADQLDDATLAACAHAGAAGVVPTDGAPDDLARAIKRVHAGEVLFAPEVLLRLLRQPRRGPAPAGRADPPASLAPRERAVLEAAAAGLDPQATAARLGIALHTVRTHLKHAMAKLGAHSRLEAVLTAIRLGLIEPED